MEAGVSKHLILVMFAGDRFFGGKKI